MDLFLMALGPDGLDPIHLEAIKQIIGPEIIRFFEREPPEAESIDSIGCLRYRRRSAINTKCPQTTHTGQVPPKRAPVPYRGCSIRIDTDGEVR